jgi:uncharacterized protein YbjQ (UPF0145 family)
MEENVMSVQNFEETFYRMTPTEVDDGEGGKIKSYVQGATLTAALFCNQSLEALKAMAQGVTSIYTLNFDKSITLAYDEYIKRASDNAIFRITSKPDDNQTPSVTALNRRTATAERTVLPS